MNEKTAKLIRKYNFLHPEKKIVKFNHGLTHRQKGQSTKWLKTQIRKGVD